MDKVIKTLYSIEERAQRIMETTSNEKKALKAQYDSKKAAYEKEVTHTTDKKIEELGLLLKKQLDEEYNETREETFASIEQLQKTFDENHSRMAKEIFHQITEV